MKGLKESGLDDAIHWFCRKGNPLLGICLGMQMLLDQSKENGNHKGLGLISGTVESIPRYSDNLFVRKTPLIGWCVLRSPVHQKDWGGTCLRNTKVGEYFYFVHSFMAIPENNEDLLAQCMYGDFPVTAAVRRDNVTGLQFHPEKSGESGLITLCLSGES
jgi:glutamine amidotransferase